MAKVHVIVEYRRPVPGGKVQVFVRPSVTKVNQGDGTIGHLLNNPGLYYDLRRLTTRLDSLTVEFRRNPRKFINLEIF